MTHLNQFITQKENEFLHTIRIKIEKHKIDLDLCAFRDPKYYIDIEYQKVGRDTLIVCKDKKKEISVEDKDFVSVFCDDLESILLNRNTQLDEFQLDNIGDDEDEEEYRREHLDPIGIRFNQSLTSILRNRDKKLQVADLYLKITEKNQITSILPYIDPRTMIRFRLYLKTSDPAINLSEMWSLDFWRLVQTRVCIELNTLHQDTLIAVKEKFFNYSKFDHTQIYFEVASEEMFENTFGVPHKYKEWSLPIPNTDEEVLEISCIEKRFIYFTRIKPSEEDKDFRKKRPIEEPLQELSLGPMRRQENEEDLKAKNAINVRTVFESHLILKNIVDYISFDGIQILRKVSRNIRQCMDKIKPDPAITNCSFDIVGLNKVQVRMRWGYYIGWYLQYEENRYGCIVSCPEYRTWRRGKYINGDYRILCLRDFEINMEHRTSGLDLLTFQLTYGPPRSTTYPFFEAFEEFFRNRTPLLKVKRLKISNIRKTTTFLQQNEVMKVVPFIDPQVLEAIDLDICHSNEDNTRNLIEVDKISKLEQWMYAKELIIRSCIVLTPIQEMNITHFAKGFITVQTISLEDLRYLKEGFQNSTTLEKYRIAYKECTFQEYRNDDIYQFLGFPHVEANPLLQRQRNIWFCRTVNHNYVLHILHYVGRSIIFSRVELSSIPEDARFQL